MLSGAGSPTVTGLAMLTAVTYSSRATRPAKNDVWLGMPGSSAVPRVPSRPGAQATSRQGPSEVLSVWERL